jgi:ribosomal protein L29
MSLKKPSEIREMQPEERDSMRALKKQVARLTTIMREIELEAENNG